MLHVKHDEFANTSYVMPSLQAGGQFYYYCIACLIDLLIKL